MSKDDTLLESSSPNENAPLHRPSHTQARLGEPASEDLRLRERSLAGEGSADGQVRGNAPKDKGGSLRRIRALMIKETLQIVRDPSSLIVAVFMPLLLLFLFGYGISFDVTKMRVGVVIENPTPETQMFVASLANTPFFQVRVAGDRRAFLDDLTAARIEGVVVLAGDFSQQLARGDTAGVQIITDGTDPNTASLVNGYVQGAWQSWITQRALSLGIDAKPFIGTEARFWFNPELESRRFLVPGSIALILMMIGSLLTALVVAREWERGTIEALLATPVTSFEFLVGKVVPNFLLGLIAMAVSVGFAVLVMGVPLRGSIVMLFVVTTAFLLVALSAGLLISTVARTQFLASQLALVTAFLPGLFFSGFIFEIASMPTPLRALSAIVPARYFVKSLQTVFLAGDIASVLGPSILILSVMSVLLMVLTWRNSKSRLE